MQRGPDAELEVVDRGTPGGVRAATSLRRATATVTRVIDDGGSSGAFSYQAVEERWAIELKPDGSATASVVVRREQQVGDPERWRFIARRALPGTPTWLMLVASGAAVLAAAAALWGAWSRPATLAPNVVVVRVPFAPSPSPSPSPVASEGGATPAGAARTPAIRTPVPLVFPLPRRAIDKADQPPPIAADLPLDARPAVRSAMTKAFASGEAEAWSDGTLSGFVVVGSAEASAGGSCRDTAILARGGQDGTARSAGSGVRPAMAAFARRVARKGARQAARSAGGWRWSAAVTAASSALIVKGLRSTSRPLMRPPSPASPTKPVTNNTPNPG